MSDNRATSEQPMELAPTPANAPVDGQESAAVEDMDETTKLALAAGVDPKAMAFWFKEKR